MFRYVVLLALFIVAPVRAQENRLTPYVTALQAGQEPVAFINAQLRTHDLIIFDDALHSALPPFQFYARLVRDPAFHGKVKTIFLEIGPMNYQPAVDAYLASADADARLLLPFLQNSTDYGFAYQSYVDLLRAVHDVNRTLPREQRLQVVLTDMPSYWPMMNTRADWDITLKSGEARDYHMYKVVASHLDHFKSGRKAILLTNTRHAYKHIRNASGETYWNAGTFFYLQHPGKTYAVRLHHAALHISKKNTDAKTTTREGLENTTFRWSRMDDGLWDSAHAELGYRPLALDIGGTPFGRAAYVGNHMRNALPGQTMYDAYDAVIFLGEIDRFQQSGKHDIYTPEFRRELARRLRVMSSDVEIADMLKQAGAPDLDAYVARTFGPSASKPEPALKQLGLEDAWKANPR
ncbi:MAG TPA: hypothetical protein VIT92_13115 [Burkholderiaceae bacterium]